MMGKKGVNLRFGIAREDGSGCAVWSSFHLVPCRAPAGAAVTSLN